ncbi:MAG: nucleotidyltransferase family protein [Peptococcaceae bacterium]|jgi:CTP:molybdopterin cytidylyltransferase MocA|nr:nucleotidyltransferase family protein [Peptococcaceae bacterium]
MIGALILAGSPNTGPLAAASQEAWEALIPVNGRPMIAYVMDALAGAGRLAQTVVVGPEELRGRTGGDVSLAPPGPGLMSVLAAAMDRFAGMERVLIATSDIPMLTAGAVTAFLDACGDMGRDIYYPVVTSRCIEERYPGCKRTYIPFREGVFTGGNLFLVNPAVMARCAEKGQIFLEARKSPLKLSRLVGWTFLVRFLLHLVSLREAETRMTRLLGVTGRVLVLDYPEIGVDVDKPDDLALARRVLGGE